MKLFVTVGTTAFDDLIKFVDQDSFFDRFEVTIQFGPGKYKPANRKSFPFTPKIEQEYKAADLVITHGGAGSIYKLLELGIPLCAIPNLERIDDHQLDICHYLSKHNFILSAEKVVDLPKQIQAFANGNVALEKFKKDNFFRAKEIAEFLLG